MYRRLIAVAGCVVCMVAGTARTQCPQLVGELSFDVPRDSIPRVTAVAVSGPRAYYNLGSVLHVADISTPSDPRAMGEVALRGDIEAIAVDGWMAYVAVGGAGVSVVDIRNPWAPDEMSTIDTESESLDVAVSEGYLYVADGSAGLAVFDLANPAHPVLVSRLTIPWEYTFGVAIGRSEECSYVFFAGSTGIRAIDVSDPQRPVEVGRYSSYDVTDIAVSGGHAFVTYRSNALRVIDVSSPSTPVVLGEVVSLFPGNGVASSVAISPSHAYVGGPLGISAVDVNPPIAPEIEGSNPLPMVSVRDIVWAGGHVYAAFNDLWTEEGGLAVLRACDGVPADFGSIECVEPPVLFASFIPAAAVASGAAGAFFQTDVEVSNTGDGEAEFSFAWLPRGQDNPNPLASADYVLAPGESRRFENALSEIFGLGPDSTGALRLVSTSESVIGMSRTYSIPVGEAGSFGQSLPAVPAAEMIPSGERRRIMFMSEDADSRANLGCVNGTDRPLQISIGMYDGGGAELDVRAMSLGPYSNNQINRLFQPWEPVRGYVDVWSDTDGALFYCYGSVLDNLTSDPTTVLPQ
jgi:hypothetical protein